MKLAIDKKATGKKLRTAIEEKGLTVKEIAFITGMSV